MQDKAVLCRRQAAEDGPKTKTRSRASFARQGRRSTKAFAAEEGEEEEDEDEEEDGGASKGAKARLVSCLAPGAHVDCVRSACGLDPIDP